MLKFVIKKLDLRSLIISKTTQICAFADYIVILSKDRKALIAITKKLIEVTGLTDSSYDSEN